MTIDRAKELLQTQIDFGSGYEIDLEKHFGFNIDEELRI